MAVKRVEAKEKFPDRLMQGLEFIVDDLEEDNPSDEPVREDRINAAICIQRAMKEYGFMVTLNQAEQVYSNYSFNKYASWLTGEPETIREAKDILYEFADDVLFGENHIGYGN